MTARKKRAECGTDSGYYRHIRTLKQPPCEPCAEAHRAKSRNRDRTSSRKCQCGRWFRTERYDKCLECRGPEAQPKALDPAEIVWEKDRHGIWRHVDVYEPSEAPGWTPRTAGVA